MTTIDRALEALSTARTMHDQAFLSAADVKLIRRALELASLTHPPGEPVMYQWRVMGRGTRAGQWSLWGDCDRDQYEFALGKPGYEVRALYVSVPVVQGGEMVA